MSVLSNVFVEALLLPLAILYLLLFIGLSEKTSRLRPTSPFGSVTQLLRGTLNVRNTAVIAFSLDLSVLLSGPMATPLRWHSAFYVLLLGLAVFHAALALVAARYDNVDGRTYIPIRGVAGDLLRLYLVVLILVSNAVSVTKLVSAIGGGSL